MFSVGETQRSQLLNDVELGITVARRRINHITHGGIAADNDFDIRRADDRADLDLDRRRPSDVTDQYTSSQRQTTTAERNHIGKQLEQFYLDSSSNESAERRLQRIEDDVIEMQDPVSSEDGPPHLPVQSDHTARAEPVIALPPLLSPRVWCNSSVADPAYIREQEVPLSDLPPPGRRFPLLTRSINFASPGRSEPGLDGLARRRNTRALLVCPASNCRLVSLSWDGAFFTDHENPICNPADRDREKKRNKSQTAGWPTLSSNKAVPVRLSKLQIAPAATQNHRRNARDSSHVTSDEKIADVGVGRRNNDKGFPKNKRRLNDDCQRENTKVLLEHISTLLSTSKAARSSH